MSCKNGKMDPRCPRALNNAPTSYCPLAVLRLKAIRNAGRELTEEEEANLPGCPWSVNHQMSNYCFFKYISEYVGNKPLSDIEIASLNNISIETVKKTERAALVKIRADKEIKAIKEAHGDSAVVPDFDTGSDYGVNR